MGIVYKARQIRLDRLVALKMILAGSHASEADLTRLRTEAEAVARLHHPNIVQIYEIGEHNGLAFLALEFCPGGSLEGRLSGTPLAPREAAALAETLARAVHATHMKGIVHRDLKPANVLLAEDGTPKVTDFGLAKKLGGVGPTASGAALGTPSYMAPEQAGARSNEIGPATDVYALGAVLYECLTGRPPFKAATQLDTMMQVVAEDPVPPSRLQSRVPRDLETICLKCLQKQPARRYGSASALADDLCRFLGNQPIQARPFGPFELAWRWCCRNRALAVLLATVFLFLITLAGGAAVVAVVISRSRAELKGTVDRIQEQIVQLRSEVEGYRTQLHEAEADLTRCELASQEAEADVAKVERSERGGNAEEQARWELARANVQAVQAMRQADVAVVRGKIAQLKRDLDYRQRKLSDLEALLVDPEGSDHR
jgi:serine/threonine-protein kinase